MEQALVLLSPGVTDCTKNAAPDNVQMNTTGSHFRLAYSIAVVSARQFLFNSL